MPHYRIQVVEHIKWDTREAREKIIKKLDYCTGFSKSEDIPIHFEKVSVTFAMSQDQ